MPSKTRWTLNPRKWFGARSYAEHKREKKTNPVTRVPPPPPTSTTSTRTIQTVSTISRTLPTKSKIKVIPLSISNDVNKTSRAVTQLQLPAFIIRREKTSTTLPRYNTFHPTHTEPTIRKNSRLEEELSIDTTRSNIQPMPITICETSKFEDSPIKQIDTSLSNMSNYCLIDYPRHSENIPEEYSLPSRSSSSSVIDDNDNSSSSGIFTDERQHTESKDTLSTLEVLSIESIADSQTSLNHPHLRPIIHRYRRPMSVFEIIDDKPQQQQNSLERTHRSHSAESTLKDNQRISTPPKSRQSSAAIIKKIEKRFPRNRSPTGTLEKAGYVRVTQDTYRLTGNQINNLSNPRKNSIDLFAPYQNFEDPLRSANDEECYATLPQTSSTEQLSNNIQNDLRIIVDECIRPMVDSIGKYRSIKNHRHKRSQAHSQLNIENITDKLLSSVDCSIYSRYQRCN